MRAYHNSRDEIYRKPFGAICIGGTVSVCLDLFEEENAQVKLRVWIDKKGESIFQMQEEKVDDYVRHSFNLKCNEACIIWYSFIIEKQDGNKVYYGAKQGRTGGEGALYSYEPPSFQITVYKERKVPSWYKNSVVYQIFPDRFNRGKDFEKRVKNLEKKRKGPERKLVYSWNDKPKYDKDEQGRIKSWEFYGGTLQGIVEKLDYLKNLGITSIYLNPIFSAASNHRYDTADYNQIDELLGDEEDFKYLCKEAEKKGISIILDGVFNHTGCDSIYFNKYGNYDEKGAFQGKESKYYDWFNFKEDGTYDCWWGVDDLPNVNESCESYQEFIYKNEDSIIKKWLQLGAKGWRLDVADELPDEFIKGIKNAVIAKKGNDGVLMGEVWEDASNKISYGELRKYFQGEELDCVMNYVFRDGIENFVLGKISAYDLAESLMSLYENYPKENFYSSLNLLGSHDRMRIMTLLGDAVDENTLSEDEKREYRLNDHQRGIAKGRLWLAVLTQMLMPGVPCIYYGDEAGLEGYSDPYNRASFPWEKIDMDNLSIYRNAISLRKIYPVFIKGDFDPVSFNDDVFGFYRKNDKSKALLLINRSLSNVYDIKLKEDWKANDIVTGADMIKDEQGYYNVTIYPLGSSVIHFRNDNALCAEMERGSGVLCHITSIPGGTLGKLAKDFVDFLARAKQKYWQILPVNPTDTFGSPYSGQSAFAGNINLTGYSISELENKYKHFNKKDSDFINFKKENDYWLDAYAMYMAIKDVEGNYENHKKYSIDFYKNKKIGKRADFYKFTQFVFEQMWQDLHSYANEKGIKIIGDMPMYVSASSCDVWADPEYFTVNENGEVEKEAGVPPDYFSKEGQLWGNPLYNWDKIKEDNYSWWLKRLKRAISLYDFTRLDHFRGFEAYWSVPKGEKAIKGEWILGVGTEVFEKAYEEFGALPFIAEDLGTITPGVRALLEKTGFPGADVIQFYDKDPENYIPPLNKIAYSGTHDNQTLRGWCIDRYFGGEENDENKKYIDEKIEILKDKLYSCRSNIVIMPLQDVLNLGDESRMNKPGTVDENWKWQALKEQLEGYDEKLRILTEKNNR